MDVSYNEMFIESLKGHPEIYDTRLKKYKDLKAKERAWEHLSATMDMPVEECMKRWRYLRDKYCREKKAAHIHELQNSKLSGGGGAASRTWPFYDCMSFLDAHIKHRIFIKSYNGHQQQQQPFSTIDPSAMQLQATNTSQPRSEESMLGNSDDQDSVGDSTFDDGVRPVSSASASSVVVVDIKEECMSPDNEDDDVDCGGGHDHRRSQFTSQHKNDFLRMSNYSTLTDGNPGVIVPHPTTMDGDDNEVDDQGPTPQQQQSIESPTSPSSNKKFRDDLQSELMEVIRATQVTINDIIRKKQANQQAPEDEDDLFGRTIAASLKNFSPIKRLRAKASIFQLLLQLQQNDHVDATDQ